MSSSPLGPHLLLPLVEGISLWTSFLGLIRVLTSVPYPMINIHNCIWFLFTTASNAFGLVAAVCEAFENRGDHRNVRGGTNDFGRNTVKALHFNYFFAWLAVLVGYPALVTQAWMTYWPVPLSHIHLMLIGVPLTAWLKRKKNLIVISTQAVSIAAISSHAFLSICMKNWWGLLGSCMMALILWMMSVPAKMTFVLVKWIPVFNAREGTVLVSGLASLVFAQALEEAATHVRGQVQSLLKQNIF